MFFAATTEGYPGRNTSAQQSHSDALRDDEREYLQLEALMVALRPMVQRYRRMRNARVASLPDLSQFDPSEMFCES